MRWSRRAAGASCVLLGAWITFLHYGAVVALFCSVASFAAFAVTHRKWGLGKRAFIRGYFVSYGAYGLAYFIAPGLGHLSERLMWFLVVLLHMLVFLAPTTLVAWIGSILVFGSDADVTGILLKARHWTSWTGHDR